MDRHDSVELDEWVELFIKRLEGAGRKHSSGIWVKEADAEWLLAYKPGALKKQREQGISPRFYRRRLSSGEDNGHIRYDLRDIARRIFDERRES